MTSFEHEQAGMTETIEERMGREAAALNELVRTCHERRICPTCSAPIGMRCRAMPAGFVVGPRGGGSGRELKHPHEARWTQEVPKR